MKSSGRYLAIVGVFFLVLFTTSLITEGRSFGQELRDLNWSLYLGLALFIAGFGISLFKDKRQP